MLNLLFFDYESSDTRVNFGQVCELSFILTDDRFKILEKSNFWLIKNHKEDSFFYVLPGKTLWMRIHDILEDKSRFGYMNFNGIYQLSSGKNLEIKIPCSAIKEENGRFVVTTIGRIIIPKKV